MASFADNIANGIAGISAGFDNQILGQASYINALQQGGVAAAGGGSPEQVVAQLNANPQMIPQAIAAMRANPQLLARVLLEAKRRPDLAARLPQPIKRFLAQTLQSIQSGCV